MKIWNPQRTAHAEVPEKGVIEEQVSSDLWERSKSSSKIQMLITIPKAGTVRIAPSEKVEFCM